MPWAAPDNDAFFARCEAFARQLQAAWEEARRIEAVWFDNAVSGDAEFVDARNRVTQDVVDMVTLASALNAFFTNGAVSAADRKSAVSRMLRGPLS